MDLLKNAPPDLRPLSPIDLDGTDLRGVEIKREWKNIDLLIICKEPRFVVVVENKVDARDHSDQLNRYLKTIREHYPDDRPLYIYLTPEGDEPSEEPEETWLSYSYADIYRVLKRIRDTCQNAIGDDVLVFLDHYLNLLGTRFMNDEKIDELCRRIYKNHRQALDLIWERTGSESPAFVEVVNVLEHEPRWHELYRTSKSIEFLPKTWLEWLPPFGPADDYPFCVHIRSKEEKLVYYVFLGPMNDAVKRKEILIKLREECPRIGFKRGRGSEIRKYVRVSAVDTFFEWDEDESADSEAIRESVKKKLHELYLNLEKLALVLKPLCNIPASGGNSKRSKI